MPFSFLIKKEGRQTTKAANRKRTINAVLISSPVIKNEMQVMKTVYKKIKTGAVSGARPKHKQGRRRGFV